MMMSWAISGDLHDVSSNSIVLLSTYLSRIHGEEKLRRTLESRAVVLQERIVYIQYSNLGAAI